MAEENQETAKHSPPNTETKVAQNSSTLVNSGMEKGHEQVNLGIAIRLDGKRKTVGFKCDEALWDAFVPWCIENYGTVCHVLEPIIMVLMSREVNVRPFMRPLHIENLIVERAVKRVRRYIEEKETETVKTVVEPGCDFCGKLPIVASFRHVSGKQMRVCNRHAKSLGIHPKWTAVWLAKASTEKNVRACSTCGNG